MARGFDKTLESKRVVFIPARMLPLHHMWMTDPFVIGVFFRLLPYLVTAPHGLPRDLVQLSSHISTRKFNRIWPELVRLLDEVAPGRWTVRERDWFKVQTTRSNVHSFFDRLVDFWGDACVYCGASEVDLEIDHIVPFSRGGTDAISNLTLACAPCNQRKRSRTAAEFGFPQVHDQATRIQ